MEWAPVTAATGALGPVITKLAALLGSEYKLRRRTRRDVKFIRSKLKPVHSILWNIWEREELDAASKALKLEALDLADEVDDAIHDFIPSLERSRDNKLLVQTKMIKASPFHDFKKRASDVSGRCRSKWKKKEKPAGDDVSSPEGKPRAYPFVRKDVSELVGMDRPRDKLIRHLVGNKTRQVELKLEITTIFGLAGMGKTTLADLVYEAIGNQFQSRAFVSVTPGGNMKDVLAKILQQVAPNSTVPLAAAKKDTKEEDLIDIIWNFLKDKRYLVIIDDIWNWIEWEIIMKCLPENSLGSRIVRTTRIVAIANKWRSDPNDWRHEMLEEQLSGREWVKDVGRFRTTLGMLAMKADLVGEGLHYYHPIVHMCGGTPLALHCMLSAVAKVREKEGEHAKRCGAVADEVQNHVMENGIHDTPGFEALVESLQLSYDDLPHHMLKTCLLYCSIYPDGQSFEKKILVRRFISERFVYTEKEGKSYIEELLNRGLILPCTVKSGNLTIDYMMRNFLRWKSRQDNFITCMSEITPSSIIRRLCICNSPPKSRDATVDPLSGLDWYHIRSLVISEGIERVPFEKLEGLRVLDLCWIKSLPDHQRRDICCLVRLRHMLGLRISELPPEIVRLQCLETFEAAEGDRLAPQLAGGFTGNLQQVQTPELRGPAITQLPREIWALQHLHTLRIRDTHISELPKEIAELQQLKILDISYTYITVLPKEIGELQQLNILDISHSDITMLPKEIGELKQLKILDISHTDITVLPKEIGELQQLKILDISYTNITVLPKEVGQLQQLKSLDIGNTHITVLPMEIRELQKLKTLDITNTGITLLPKVIGELQHLEHLFLTGTEVAKIPREIGALKELKKLKLAGSKAALPLEVCALVELPECIQQVFNKNGLVSELAGELLSFRQSLNTLKSAGGTGGLVVGAKQMHMPRWISQHFNDLAVLDIRICKLEKQGLKILREMPKLEDLTLRFEVVPKEPAVISSEGFATLSDLTIESRVPRVTFQEGAMPKLYSLKFRFQFYAGPAYEDPVGINHLRGLSSIKFKCNEGWYGGGDSPCIRRTIDVVKKEAQELPRLHKFEVCGCKEMIYKPPPPLRIGQQREMEQGEMEEEEWERSIGEVEIEEEIIQA